ncbi:hypothetical protein F7644_12115 [Tenacibaculum finnmarkense genomovar ulcerans]|uniref:NADase-type glycan-binding domain-containing protein n=1 Tax=Tenacibaculum finnmarkense TaxID=2781243 RepID=UPI00187B7F80|nr:hypothetical protein [Tenacibaculum finnmarkense]MBE7646724.1 hypothetical protein [Tenacibaculum finnmarkense genomovar ulcerans]
MKPLIILLSFLYLHPSINIVDIYPSNINLFEFKSSENEKKYNKIFKKCHKIEKEMDKLHERDWSLQMRYDDLNCGEYLYPWKALEGCSWYCGGSVEKTEGSSHIKSSENIDYYPKNISDLNYRTVWATKNGIEENLTFTFIPNTSKISNISIANGYIKNKTAWKNNSRVRKIKVYYNNTEICILNLEDSRSEQTFIIPELGYDKNQPLTNKKDWTIKLQIMEIYKGDKYQDLVISEVMFGGNHHH